MSVVEVATVEIALVEMGAAHYAHGSLSRPNKFILNARLNSLSNLIGQRHIPNNTSKQNSGNRTLR